MKTVGASTRTAGRHSIGTRLRRNWVLYVFLLPAVLYIAVFSYAPMYGVQIAFKDFVAARGIWGSQWVGWKHFVNFFNTYQFWTLIRNTVILSFYQLVASFPFPILLAILFNYIPLPFLKRFSQTATYAPHFISMVVMVGMIHIFLGPTGLFNQLLRLFSLDTVMFLGRPEMFRSIYVWSGVWQDAGWNSVIYIAALAGVSPELHEAAIVDGASKLRRIWHIDIPAILPTAVILLVMNTGNLLSLGFEKAYLMQNDINIVVSEILSTYVYKIGLLGGQFSYSTAIGLFNNGVNLLLLVIVNRAAKKATGTGLW